MKPPICELCCSKFDASTEGGLVKFADFEPLHPGITGHPKGLLWFCKQHYEAAQTLTNHSSAAALKHLRRKY